MKKSRLNVVVLTVLASLWALPTTAEWSHDSAENNPVCTAAGYQEGLQMVSDGTGGAIMAWHDYRSGSWDIHAQRVDAAGNMLWMSDGEPVCSAASTQSYPQLVSDDTGGAIIAWTDQRSGDNHIYAQRVNSSGNMLWTTNGVAVCTANVSKAAPQLIGDGSAGAIIAWSDHRYVDRSIFAQRINQSGTPLWTANGEAVCTVQGIQFNPRLASDGMAGAIIAWEDERFGAEQRKIYVQRIDGSGYVLWDFLGEAVCTLSELQTQPQLISDGANGAIIVLRCGDWSGNIRAQRVASNSNRLWTAEGKDIGDGGSAQLIYDGWGGAIIAWDGVEVGSTSTIHGQRLDAAGNKLWSANGEIVCDIQYRDQTAPQLVSDGVSGAIIAWESIRGYFPLNIDIYAQRVNGSGTMLWTHNGEPVCSVPLEDQYATQIVSDGSAGAVVAWQDRRSGAGEKDIYAQRIDNTGHLDGAPLITEVIDRSSDQGGTVSLSWLPSYLDASPRQLVTSYSVWMRVPDAIALHGSSSLWAAWTRVEDIQARYQIEYTIDVPTYEINTGIGEIPWTDYRVIAHTADPLVYWESAVASGYSLDNLMPGAPQNLTGTTAGTNALLHWDASGVNDEDLAFYRIYRSSVPGFTPDTSALIHTTIDRAFSDRPPGTGIWFYLVTAEDIHGNESQPSNETSTTIDLTVTVDASLTCLPSSGTLPFNTQFTASMTNKYTEQARRFQYQIDAALANGQNFSNWRRGWQNVPADTMHTTTWWQTMPLLGALVGNNRFLLTVADITPPPFNQPPYPPAGDMLTTACTVRGDAP